MWPSKADIQLPLSWWGFHSLIHLVTMVPDIPSTLGMKHRTGSPVPHFPCLALNILPFIHHHYWGSRVPFLRVLPPGGALSPGPELCFQLISFATSPSFSLSHWPSCGLLIFNLFLWKLLSLPISPSFLLHLSCFSQAPSASSQLSSKTSWCHFLLIWSNVT